LPLGPSVVEPIGAHLEGMRTVDLGEIAVFGERVIRLARKLTASKKSAARIRNVDVDSHPTDSDPRKAGRQADVVEIGRQPHLGRIESIRGVGPPEPVVQHAGAEFQHGRRIDDVVVVDRSFDVVRDVGSVGWIADNEIWTGSSVALRPVDSAPVL